MAAQPETIDPAAARLDEDAVTAEVIRKVFARYDPLALAVALGAVGGLALLAGTAVLLLRGGYRVGETLSLLGHYFIAYEVSWTGALIGLVEGAIGGFVFGFGLALAINVVVGVHETAFRLQVDMMQTFE